MAGEVYFRKTRKIYSWFYLLVLLLIGGYFYIRWQGNDIRQSFLIGGIIISIAGIKLIEASRLHNLYGFNDQFVFHKKGFIRKNVKTVFLGRISDLVLSGGFINRLFNYGNVDIHHFGGSGVIEIRKINDPWKFVRDLQERMGRF